MYYIVAEDGEVFKTSDRKEALDASDDGISIVIDASVGVAIVDREATAISLWEPPEDGSDDEDEGDDE